MSGIIPFDKIEKILIDKGIYKPNKTSRGDFCFCKKVSVKGIIGRPSVPSKILVGTMFCKVGMVCLILWQRSLYTTEYRLGNF